MTTSQEPAGAPGMMIWPLVAIGAVLGGLAGGFVTHNLPVAAACALLGAGAVGILAWQAIGRLAQEQEYADWVARRGWRPALNLPAALVTSLLRAGDTRRLEDRLFVADEESELVVRRVFTPALIVQLVDLAGARMTIEFETGALICSVHGRVGTTELLDAMEAASVAVADALCEDATPAAPAYVPAHAAQP